MDASNMTLPPTYEHSVAMGFPQQAQVRHILAERYKTKMCRNYLTTGVCPYETRCMFAHGERELRTTEMNLQDGLITEEAIRNFQRVHVQQQHLFPAPPPPPTALSVYRHEPYAVRVLPAHIPCDCEECSGAPAKELVSWDVAEP